MGAVIEETKTRRKAAGSWQDRWLAIRDLLLASPRFHRWASRFPLTRRIARRRSTEVFDLVAGFVYSQVLVACVRLGLFEILAAGPATLEALSRSLGLDAAATDRLLAAALSLRLVERRSQARFGLGVRGAPLVGNASVAAMVEHHALLYADLADPVALLRGHTRSRLAEYWAYAGAADPRGASAAQVKAYSTLMSASQPLVADEILDALPLRRHRCLLDVGGGEGTFVIAAARRAPNIDLLLFDLPSVIERSRTRIAAAGLEARVRVVGGSFFDDPLPLGASVATLIRVLHDHDDANVLVLLRAVRDALPPGGTVVVAEPMAETQGAEAMGSAYFGFYLLAMGTGRPRSAEDLSTLLRSAGFTAVKRVRTAVPLQASLLFATRPFAKTPVSRS